MKDPKDFKGDVVLLVPFHSAPLTLDLNQETPHQKKTKTKINEMEGSNVSEMSRYVPMSQSPRKKESKAIRINSKFPSRVKAGRMNLTCLQFTSPSLL